MTEGQLIQTKSGFIFDVKGLVHPPGKVIAFPRFIPDSSGNRELEGRRYKKVYSISARFKFLEQTLPDYIVYDRVFDERLCEVPLKDVSCFYEPTSFLQELRCSEKLDTLEREALEFLKLLKEYTNVSWSKLGISGSLLVKLHTKNSDIDPIVYGSKNCREVHKVLRTLVQNKESQVKPYSKEELQKLFQFRLQDTQTSFEDFVKTESRKALQGKFKGRDYFMRFVKDSSEIQEDYGAVQYKNMGYAEVKAEVEDDSEAIFTPCNYKIRKVKVLEGARSNLIDEIASFRGRFCEQAKKGEVIIARGKVEHVSDCKQNREHFRLLLGNKPSDFMVLA